MNKFIMNHLSKIIASGIIAIIICFFGYFIYGFLTKGHSVNRKAPNQYLWIFKDTIQEEVRNNFPYSYVTKTDTYNCFQYNNFIIVVWEFRNVPFIDLERTKLAL